MLAGLLVGTVVGEAEAGGLDLLDKEMMFVEGIVVVTDKEKVHLGWSDTARAIDKVTIFVEEVAVELVMLALGLYCKVTSMSVVVIGVGIEAVEEVIVVVIVVAIVEVVVVAEVMEVRQGLYDMEKNIGWFDRIAQEVVEAVVVAEIPVVVEVGRGMGMKKHYAGGFEAR